VERRRDLLLCAALLLVGVAGCTTIIDVERYTGTQQGLRYSLPATYLLVTPKADGSATYEWVSLPDPANEYVVRATSWLSKYTLDLTFDNGMLTKVTSKQDATDVPVKAIQAAQTVYAARVAAAAARAASGAAVSGAEVGRAATPAPEATGIGQAWGPVLFKVVVTADDVMLVAVNPQQAFDTVTVVKPAKPTK
jgi:hypothetical protein